ncbi:RagB/SusD family nutrient uptake outer membrane protein [Pseudoflavitalea rhizosphaerae]|uniref:RagB/SusD family nutrient uptake outer membrane protein n=1 Tax=Pseudoflavitalea rhizosphaerae TaxID=1884793 RepID=UPI000F8F7815|nr:RagB/SusD family nutrient uptake outer membrane protein [Pseudoflavitalea rhizosphaerae]
MKNKLIYIAILLVTFTSCKKYFEVDNSDRETIPNLFSKIEGFRSSILGTYGLTFDYYASYFYYYPEVAGNMVDITKTGLNVMKQQQDFLSDPEEEIQAVGYIWRRVLTTIANANNIIEQAPEFVKNNPNHKTEVDQIKAQALFIRALAHFDLCRAYAQPWNYTADAGHPGVPIVLKNPAPEDKVSRASVKDVYAQVIKDLKEAETLFGNSTAQSTYYASKKSVQALLARVYLYSEKWDDAISYAGAVIGNSTLAYENDYAAMFNDLAPGVETIFRLNGRLRTKKLGEVYALKDATYVPADTLMSLFKDPTDIRLGLFQTMPDIAGKYLTKKWTITVQFDGSTEKYDPMVLRVSEMYMIRAEANLAKDRMDLAADDLKVLIGRALKKDPADIAFSDMSKNFLTRTLIEERAKEFCFEGHNFFDITRMKQNLVRGATTTSIVKRIDYPSNFFILPIPQSEIDANPGMTGNPAVNK